MILTSIAKNCESGPIRLFEMKRPDQLFLTLIWHENLQDLSFLSIYTLLDIFSTIFQDKRSFKDFDFILGGR